MSLIRPRRVVSRSVGMSIMALTFLSVTLAAAIIMMFSGLVERQAAAQQSVRENAMWAAYQADREASRFVESLARHDLDAAQVHYDILYSRMSLIGSGQYAVSFDERSQVGQKAKQVAQLVLDLTETMDRLREDPTLFAARRLTLLDQAEGIQRASADLIITANSAISDAKVALRHEEQQTYWKLGIAVMVLTGALIIMIGLLAFQIRQTSRSGRELELLSRKNQRAAETALAATRAKSTFLATMSHEIRTPLNGIVGMAELMSGTTLNTEQRQHLRAIRTSAGLLLDVISDVLDYSKLEAAGVQIDRKAYALPALETALMDVLGARALASGLSFAVSLPQVQATLDAGRLRQVLVNLAGNAIKFTPEGGSVSISGRLDGETLRVEVSDTGPGISPEAQSRLFREFSQVDGSNTRTHGGTGLGLAISKRLIEAMGGQVGVSSVLGQGSLFWVELPAGPLADLDLSTVAPESSGRSAGRSGRALVVEDNAINRQVAGGLLRKLGLHVDFAENGLEAVQTVAANPPDLVFMDMQMPVMDGLDATRAIRAAGYAGPIVGLTANAFTTDRQACLDAGMDDFLAKPVTLDKLSGVLDAIGRVAAVPVETLPEADAALLAPVVDEDYRRMMMDEFGADEFADLCARSLRDAVALVAEARNASTEEDYTAYDAALHRLKGSALTVGFNALAQAAQALRAGLPSDASALAVLEHEIERARAA